MDNCPRALQALVGGLSIALGIACGGTEPGTVILALDGVEDVTTADTIQLTGTLTRSPPANTSLFVTVSGGLAATTDTADDNGRFATDVALRLDQSNTLTVTPQDGTGSMGQPVSLTVVHDGSGPTVVMITPSGDGVSTTLAPVQVRLSEPVLAGPGAQMTLSSGSYNVPGTFQLATDSVTLTFTPTAGPPLPENSVFSVAFQGVTDLAGNEPDVETDACFITQLTVPSGSVFTDTTFSNQDVLGFFTFGGPEPQFINPADLSEVRTGIQDSVLTVLMKFTNDRSFAVEDQSNTFAFIDIDIDQDSTTGARTFRDSLYINVMLPTRTSGTRAEYGLFVDHFGGFGDSALVAQYTGLWSQFGPELNAIETFWPSFCGEFIGVRAALSLMGSDEGNMDISIMVLNVEGTSATDPIVVDLAPDSMAYNLNYAGLFSPPLRAAPLGSLGGVQVRFPGHLLRFIQR